MAQRHAARGHLTDAARDLHHGRRPAPLRIRGRARDDDDRTPRGCVVEDLVRHHDHGVDARPAPSPIADAAPPSRCHRDGGSSRPAPLPGRPCTPRRLDEVRETRRFKRFVEIVGAAGGGGDVGAELILDGPTSMARQPLGDSRPRDLCRRTALARGRGSQRVVEPQRQGDVEIPDCGRSHGKILPCTRRCTQRRCGAGCATCAASRSCSSSPPAAT